MPAYVHCSEVSPERSTSKLSRALSKLSLRTDDDYILWKDQVNAFKPLHSKARKILCDVPIPLGLSSNRVREFIHSTSITPRGKAFPPQCSEIIPNRLFVADRFTGTDATTLLRLRITHVVCIANASDQEYIPSLPLPRHKVVVPNDPYQARRLIATIDDTVDFIDNALEKDDTRVLVHCLMGVHWGPSMAIAWLMRNEHCTYEKARKQVRRKREVVDLGLDLERGVKEWWALESARPMFPPGRGGRYPPLTSHLASRMEDAKDARVSLETEDVVIDIRRYF